MSLDNRSTDSTPGMPIMKGLLLIQKLQFSVVRFELTARTRILIPEFQGNILRGVFGMALKRTVCVWAGKNCQSCPFGMKCPYIQIFESKILPPWFGSTHAPVPFLLRPPEQGKPLEIAEGEKLIFRMVLIGTASELFPFIVAAWLKCGEKWGLGRARRQGWGRFCLSGVYDETTPEPVKLYDGSRCKILAAPRRENIGRYIRLRLFSAEWDNVKISLETPLRIQHGGFLVGPYDLTPKILLAAIYWRAYLLTACYADKNLPAPAVPAFPESPALKSQLYWKEWERYSKRQDAKMILGGIVGELIVGKEYKKWLPLFLAAEIFHVGKATSFGFGQIFCTPC